MTKTDERFEERLLTELREVVAQRPTPSASTAAAAPRPARLTWPRVGVATGAAAAATAAAVAIVAGGGSAAPAYAVEPRDDGSVVVEITSLRDAAGLQRELGEAGIPAVVDYLPDGKTCREPRFDPPAPGRGPRGGMMIDMSDEGARFTISRGGLLDGQTLVIVSSLGEGVSSIGTAIAEGPVAPCEPVDDPLDALAPPGEVTDGADTAPADDVDSGPGVESSSGTGPRFSTSP